MADNGHHVAKIVKQKVKQRVNPLCGGYSHQGKFITYQQLQQTTCKPVQQVKIVQINGSQQDHDHDKIGPSQS